MTRIEDLWRTFRTPLLAFVQKRVRHIEDAEDLLAEVFLRLHERAAELEDIADVRAWLYQVTRRAIIDHYRKARTSAELTELYDLPQEPGDDHTVELAGCIERVMESLGDADRRALTTIAAGSSQEDLAEREGLSATGARSRVQRARTKLIDAFRACCRTEFDGTGRIIDWQRRAPCDGQGPSC